MTLGSGYTIEAFIRLPETCGGSKGTARSTHHDRVIEQSFFGWIGDVRIVDRPLPVEELMTAR